MRWKSWCTSLALLVAGCSRPCYLTCEDANASVALATTGFNELDPRVIAKSTLEPCPPPQTVIDPERPIRYLSLAEAIAIALEQGTTGNQTAALSNLAGGSATGILVSSDQLVSFTGRGLTSTDAIRVLAIDPATIGVGVEQSLSKFDATWFTSASWQNTDRPVGTALDVFQTGNNATNDIRQMDATVSTGIIKPLPTGGVAGITFNTQYTLTNLASPVNPSYRPDLQFAFEQPLLQGYGVEINQLRPNHPGSQILNLLPNGAAAPTPEGILITRVRYDQSRAEFQRNVHSMLVNVEIAYWNLYNSYWQLYSQEAGMRFAYEAWRILSAKFAAGRANIADLAQTRGQYELFRGQRLSALGDLQENERQLRAMLGMRAEDGTRLVPSDTPTLAPYAPDWNSAWQETQDLRPELILARQEVKANQLNVILQENNLLPDLRFAGTYDINGLGSRLDGDSGTNALRSFASNRFDNWQLQLRLNVPIGFRNAHANLRIAKLQLERSLWTLHDNELKAERFLRQQYERILVSYELIRIRRAQRESFADTLRARYQEYIAGRGTPDALLEAQRFWASALADEFTAIRDYNNVLAGFEFAKGTILQHDNVVISEGPLPACAQKRAVEHLRERTAALELRDRAVPKTCTDCVHDAIPVPSTTHMPSIADMPKLPVPQPEELKAMPKETPTTRSDGTPAPAPAAIPVTQGGETVLPLSQTAPPTLMLVPNATTATPAKSSDPPAPGGPSNLTGQTLPPLNK